MGFWETIAVTLIATFFANIASAMIMLKIAAWYGKRQEEKGKEEINSIFTKVQAEDGSIIHRSEMNANLDTGKEPIPTKRHNIKIGVKTGETAKAERPKRKAKSATEMEYAMRFLLNIIRSMSNPITPDVTKILIEAIKKVNEAKKKETDKDKDESA